MKLRLIFASLAALLMVEGQAGSATVMKPVIQGFIDMQDIDWHNTDHGKPAFTLDYIKPFPGLFGGMVLNAAWNEMQPAPNRRLDTHRIDAALAEVADSNRHHPDAPLGVKLRIFGGNQAPGWAWSIDGGPVVIQRNPLGCHVAKPPGCPIHIGQLWDPNYIRAWRVFQRLVAMRYDANPLIRAVAVTSCAMETDEPFVMPTGQTVGHGYTDTAQRHCLAGAVDDYAGWHRTAIDFTFNTFQPLQSANPELGFTLSVMNECRRTLGPRCELGNHAFSSPLRTGIAPIVDAIAERGGAIHYQMTGPTGFNWADSMRLANRKDATAIALCPQFGGFTTFRKAKITRLHSLFDGQ